MGMEWPWSLPACGISGTNVLIVRYSGDSLLPIIKSVNCSRCLESKVSDSRMRLRHEPGIRRCDTP
jgi:hypothetical protein